MTGYVYKIVNTINGKIYVGQKKGMPTDSENYYGSGMLIKRAIEKYGIQQFKKEILCLCFTQDELNRQETFWIQELKAYDRNLGYNISKTNFGGDTYTNNPNLENIKLNKSRETSGEKNPMFGVKYTEERRNKQRKTIENNGGLSGENNPRFNDHRKYDELYGPEKALEIKEKQSEALKGDKSYKYKKLSSEGTLKIIQSYESGGFPKYIGKDFGLSETATIRLLKENKVKFRTASESQKIQHRNRKVT